MELVTGRGEPQVLYGKRENLANKMRKWMRGKVKMVLDLFWYVVIKLYLCTMIRLVATRIRNGA